MQQKELLGARRHMALVNIRLNPTCKRFTRSRPKLDSSITGPADQALAHHQHAADPVCVSVINAAGQALAVDRPEADLAVNPPAGQPACQPPSPSLTD